MLERSVVFDSLFQSLISNLEKPYPHLSNSSAWNFPGIFLMNTQWQGVIFSLRMTQFGSFPPRIVKPNGGKMKNGKMDTYQLLSCSQMCTIIVTSAFPETPSWHQNAFSAYEVIKSMPKRTFESLAQQQKSPSVCAHNFSQFGKHPAAKQ